MGLEIMTHREVWKVIVFGLITLGIYDLYWIYKTRNELVAKGNKVPKFIILFVPLIAMVAAVIFNVILLTVTSDSTGSGASTAAGGAALVGGLLIILASLASIPISLWWFYHYCKAVEHVTGGKTSFGMAYGLAIVLSLLNVAFVWPGIIQDGFNKAGTEGAPAPTSPSTPADPPYPPVSSEPPKPAEPTPPSSNPNPPSNPTPPTV
jgi:hypothetical protein